MDTSRLANLSLAEIASTLSAKQQEVLLASISVAATYIQQLQAAEEQEQLRQTLQHTQCDINNDSHSLPLSLSQHHTTQQSQQQTQQLQDQQLDSHHQSLHHQSQHELDDDTDEQIDQSSDISFEDYSCASQDQSTSIADKETLATIRGFADELKDRRKRIRLSQKGAAQSLRAFTNGAQPCTDAIIYHFENLQLEPDRAMQLIPLLKDWLEWAEDHRNTGKQLPMMSAVTKVPRERKRKVVLFNEKAKQYLEDAFLKNNHPDRYQLDMISNDLHIPTRSIRKWFTNRRQRKRFAEKFSPVN